MVQMDTALLSGLLAEQLVARSHRGIERVYFCNSGAEAVETAVKFARAATQRSKIIYFSHAYHGLTMGALALNGSPEFRKGFGPLMPDVIEVPFGDVEALAAALAEGDVAALIAEPIQGKGVFELAPETWRDLARQVHEAGALFICDEVQTGLGRTGKLYAHEHFGLTPDIITVSKALSGGYVPVAATLTSDRIFRATYSTMERALVHSTTFKCNQLAMVAGLATLHVFDSEGVVAHAAAMEDVWKARLGEVAERHEFIRDVRGRGQMIGVEFGPPVSATARRRWRLLEAARPALFSQTLVMPLFTEFGILTQVAADSLNVIKLLPPLIAGADEIDQFASALDTLLTRAETQSGWITGFGVAMAKGAVRTRRAALRVRAR